MDNEINELVKESLEKIDMAIQKIFLSRENSKLYSIETIAKAKIALSEFQKPIFERHPELRPPPPKDYIPDQEITEEQRKFINLLSPEKLEEIDNALLSCASKHYLKVARLVGDLLINKDIHIEGIPDIFYSERIRLLVKNGFLESQGNLYYMRYSEVRLSRKSTTQIH